MSVCGQNAVFFGHTYSKFGDSGVKPTSREHLPHALCNSMESQRANFDLTTNPVNPLLSAMADHHNRPFVGHHGLNGLPPGMLDHWPSPPLAHNHHHINNNNSNSINSNMNNANNYNTTASSNNNNNNSNNNNNNSSGNNLLGSCIQNQCNISEMDTSSSSTTATSLENNNSPLAKNGECPIIPNDNHNMNSSNNNNNNKNNNNNNSNNNSTGNGSMSDGDSPSSRQNQVGTIVLHGVAIVSLIIDNKERLCLAQISNTLLKEYSYNEIHNRRVALGITCVQCTPVQLEILRRAGAMPVSSRRCGMITKREAERLVKSFLEDNDPPKLPDDFAFDVIHECGWGCRGLFEPARYNSSRAKCIKCIYCSMYFSPNKFIFHFHRTPGAKYNHPDAANFNSWRRHLKLNQVQDKDEITFKWEDVKAMFNGGTRKRIGSSATSSSSSSTSPSSSSLSSSKLSSHISSSTHHHHHSSSTNNNINSNHHNPHSHHHHPHHQTPTNRSASSYQHNPSVLDGASSAKKAKTSSMMEANSFLPKPAPFSNPFTPYGWLGASTQNKAAAYPFMTMNSAQSMCFGFPPHMPSTTNNKDALMERMKSAPVGVGNAPAWMNRNPVLPFQLASMDLLWDKTFGFPSAAAVAALGGFRNGSYPPSIFPGTNSHMGMDMNEHLSPPRDNTPCLSPNPGLPPKLMSPSIHERGEKGGSRTSAFTRVVPSMSPPSSASLSPQNSNIDRNTPSRNGDDDDDDDDDANDNNNDTLQNDNSVESCHDAECNKMESGVEPHRDVDDSEEIDVEDHSEDRKRVKYNNNNNNHSNNNNSNSNNNNDSSSLTHHQNRDICITQPCSTPHSLPVSLYSLSQQRLAEKSISLHSAHRSNVVSPTNDASRQLSLPSSPRSDDESAPCDNRSNGRESVLSGVSESAKSYQSNPRDIAKEECFGEDAKIEHNDIKEEDEEMSKIKDQFSKEATRETSFQEHMSKQLEMLRETLTTELEQERKIRYSLQEKLKQAHEALNSFSCGLLPPSGDANSNLFKDANALPR